MSHTPEELIQLGYQCRREGRLREAKRRFAESVELCRGGTDPTLLAGSLIGLGQIERDLKNNEAAVQHYSEAIALYRSSGHPLRLAHTVRHLADILRGMRSIESARALY